MRIWAKPYKSRDGLIYYINNNRGVSIAIGKRVLTSKFTAGQQKLYSGFFKILETAAESAPAFNGDLAAHREMRGETEIGSYN
jgi:hypothetical protein